MPGQEVPALTDAQRKAVESFSKAADAIAAALAKDDLLAFNKAAPDAMKTTEVLTAALADRADLTAELKALSDARHLGDAVNIIAARKMFQLFIQCRLGRSAQLVHHRPALARRHQHFAGAGHAMAMRILSRLVEIEFVMRMLDERDAEALHDQTGNDFFDQGGFAATGVASDADDFHNVNLAV